MEFVLIPTVWLPIICLAVLLALARWTKTPRFFFLAAGWVLLLIGFLLSLFGMGIRGAIVPGDYSGWSNWQIWRDQAFFAGVMGGTSIAVGLFCLMRLGK